MGELPVDLLEEILVRSKAKDLVRYKSVCKSWYSLISSDPFVKSHLNYNLKKKNAYNDTRIVLAGPSSNDSSIDIVGSSNGLICLLYRMELFVINPSTRQVKKLKSPPRNPDYPYLIFSRVGFGYDSSIDDYKVVIGFNYYAFADYKYHFLVLKLKTNVWKSVALELDYKLLPNGVLCNGAIHWFALDQNYNPILLSFDLSKEVFKEIPTPPLQRFYSFREYYTLGAINDRLCIFYGCSITPFDQRELWLMKNYNLQEPESIWEQMLLRPPCNDTQHEERMLERGAHVFKQRVKCGRVVGIIISGYRQLRNVIINIIDMYLLRALYLPMVWVMTAKEDSSEKEGAEHLRVKNADAKDGSNRCS